MDSVSTNLWISDAAATRELADDHRFDEVVTLGYFDGWDLERPNASTTGDRFLFRDGPHDYSRFAAATDFVLAALGEQQTVLVHCMAGISRSAGVCAAALALQHSLSPSEALGMVQSARPRALPESEIRDSISQYVREHAETATD